jgi:hypothetical protein
MPEQTEIKENAGMENPAENNARVAQQLKAQDISGQSTVTGDFGDATAALDKLAAQVVPKADEPKPDAPKPDAPKPDAPKPDAPKPDVVPDADPSARRAEELFKDSPSLPPNASPKSSEAFSSIKVKAAQEILAREREIEELKKQVESAKNPSPEQLQREKELEDHRLWRAKMDVDFDPKFKEFDKDISKQREFIYAQLLQSPAITKETIDQIKKYGGPDMINLTALFESVKDPTLQRLVEAKVADIAMAKYNKEQAVLSAKTNITQYLEERKTALSQETAKSRQETVTKLDEMLGRLDWFADKAAPATADPADRKQAEEHNQFLAGLRQQLSVAAQDDTPEMKAVLMTGMAQLFHLQRRVPGLESGLAAAQKELSEVKAKWEAVKSSSRSRLTESQAPAGGIARPREGIDVNARASDSLDAIARQVMEARAAAASGQ